MAGNRPSKLGPAVDPGRLNTPLGRPPKWMLAEKPITGQLQDVGRLATQGALEFAPGIDDVLSAQEALTGVSYRGQLANQAAGKLGQPEELGWLGRGLSGLGVLPFIPGAIRHIPGGKGMVKKGDAVIPGEPLPHNPTTNKKMRGYGEGETKGRLLPQPESAASREIKTVDPQDTLSDSLLEQIADAYMDYFGQFMTTTPHKMVNRAGETYIDGHFVRLGNKILAKSRRAPEDAIEYQKKVLWHSIKPLAHKAENAGEFQEIMEFTFGDKKLAHDFLRSAGIEIKKN